MKARHTPVEMVQVEILCDACGEGSYQFAGLTQTSNPPKFAHKCNRCGDPKYFLNKFPSVGHRPNGNPRVVDLTIAEEKTL